MKILSGYIDNHCNFKLAVTKVIILRMIRKLQESDINGLNNLKPDDWNFDFEEFINKYFKDDFYYAFVIIHEKKIVGTGSVFLKAKIGWLGNIIIAKKYRGKGLGFEMTEFLVRFLKEQGCETQLLIATKLGESVYNRVGFKKISEYICFDLKLEEHNPISKSIRPLQKSDILAVYNLDFKANDEDRRHLLDKHYGTGFGYFNRDKELLGIYLPDFGNGLILSENEIVGFEFLKIKHSQTNQRTLIPIENTAGISFLESLGNRVGVTASRMIMGKENKWNPKYIYSYGGGYCG